MFGRAMMVREIRTRKIIDPTDIMMPNMMAMILSVNVQYIASDQTLPRRKLLRQANRIRFMIEV